jgi:hypothetical protein
MKKNLFTLLFGMAALLPITALHAQATNEAGTGAAVAAGTPAVFGPVTYTRTQGPPDTFTDSFTAPAVGGYTLYIKNGDDNEEGDADGRVSSASLLINGEQVVGPDEFNQTVASIEKAVNLVSGTNTISATIAGQPGAYITVSIAAVPVDITHGRLLLSWVGGGVPARIALKNGSHLDGRVVQAVFFNPDGTVACRSRRLFFPPHGSTEVPVQNLLGACTAFTGGSIEFYWAGHGPARVFGHAILTANATGDQVALPLLRAGYHARRVERDAPPPPPPIKINPNIRKTTS